jgi:hypothetical protein
MTLFFRVTKSLCFVWSFAFLTSCSGFRKIAYDWADVYMMRNINETFDLTSAQEKLLDLRIAEIAKWHRKEELKNYDLFLEEFEKKVGDGINREEIAWAQTEVNKFVKSVAFRVAPVAGEFLVTLSDDQLLHLEKSNAKRNKQREKKLTFTDKKWLQESGKDLQGHLKFWVGNVTFNQMKLVDGYVSSTRKFSELKLEHSKKTQAEFISILKLKISPKEWEEKIYSWMTEPEKRWSEEYKKEKAQNEQKAIDLILALDQSLSTAQRQDFLQEIKKLKSDIDTLAHKN